MLHLWPLTSYLYNMCLAERKLGRRFSSQPGDSVLSLFNPKPASLTNNHLLGKNCQLIHILKQNLCHHNTVSLWPCQCSLCCSCDSLWFFRYVQAGQSNLQFQLLLFESWSLITQQNAGYRLLSYSPHEKPEEHWFIKQSVSTRQLANFLHKRVTGKRRTCLQEVVMYLFGLRQAKCRPWNLIKHVAQIWVFFPWKIPLTLKENFISQWWQLRCILHL